eukprot:3369275-Amphidinium_carterae.1
MSTEINGIYMLCLRTQQLHRRETPTLFEGNNKSDTTAGSLTTSKNWASEPQTYMHVIEDRSLTDILEAVKRQTIPIYDDSFVENKLDMRDLSTYEADRRRAAKLQCSRMTTILQTNFLYT